MAKIISELLSALNHSHEQGIAHRDIKPENIMWGDDDEVRLVDFGLAFEVKKKSQKHLGTPFFMPPEVILEQPYSTTCDIWSLGCVLYMLVTGELPFNATNTSELFPKILKAKYKTPACSPECINLLTKMLEID